MTYDEMIEAAAIAYYRWATCNPGEPSRWDEAGPHQEFARIRAQVMLDAAGVPALLERIGDLEQDAEGWQRWNRELSDRLRAGAEQLAEVAWPRWDAASEADE